MGPCAKRKRGEQRLGRLQAGAVPLILRLCQRGERISRSQGEGEEVRKAGLPENPDNIMTGVRSLLQ